LEEVFELLPVEKHPCEVGGLTPEMTAELEKRVQEFEREHEEDVIANGTGYVPKIRKGDYLFAGLINAAITIYMIIAVIIM